MSTRDSVPGAWPDSTGGSSRQPSDNSLIQRGSYNTDLLSKSIFFVGRALDPILQYSILAHGLGTPLLHRVGLRTLPPGLPAQTGIPFIDTLHLSPYRLVLLSMSVGAAVKQNLWIAFLSRERISVKSALIVALFNAGMNSLGTYTFLLSSTSASVAGEFPQTQLLAGGLLFVAGIALELVSEIQRDVFKKDPKNKGKVYKGGLFGLARHINYGGYTLWRSGYAVACGGWVFGGLVAAFFGYQFHTASIPEIDEYCQGRYGGQWKKYKQETKWKMLPGIY